MPEGREIDQTAATLKTGADAGTHDAADGGWDVDSASAPSELAPDDTTEAAIAAEAAAAAAAADQVDEADPDADPEPTVDDGHESAGREAATRRPAAPAGKKPKPVAPRLKSIQADIDRAIFKKSEAEREETETRTRLTKLRAELAETEGKRPGAPAPKTETPPPAAKFTEARPVRPKYADFPDFDKFEEALGQWEGKVSEWEGRRDVALRTEIRDEITGGLDTRLKTDRESAEATASEQRYVQELNARLDAAKAKHPDWDTVKESFADLRSSWYDPAKHGPSSTPFLVDLAMNNVDEGAELLHWLGSHPDEAQVLADLQPTRALRDALVMAPSPIALMAHFATDAGQNDWNAIKVMHPIRAAQAVGALSAQVAAASRGPAGLARHPITAALPSAKPPAGAPRAQTGPTSESGEPKDPFEKWMADEDQKELAANDEQLRRAVGR